MNYNKVRMKDLEALNGRSVWFARITDHPQYTIEHELEGKSVKELIIPPMQANIKIIGQTTLYNGIDAAIYNLNNNHIITYNRNEDDEYVLIHNEYYIASSNRELKGIIKNGIKILISDAISEREYKRVKWYTHILSYFDKRYADELIEKNPQLYV